MLTCLSQSTIRDLRSLAILPWQPYYLISQVFDTLPFHSFMEAFQLLPLDPAHIVSFISFLKAHAMSSCPQTKNYSKNLEELTTPLATLLDLLFLVNENQEPKGSV